MTELDDKVDDEAYNRGIEVLSQINDALKNKQYIVYGRLLKRFSMCIEFLERKSLQDDLYHRLNNLHKAYNR
jgi:hypothetical protein